MIAQKKTFTLEELNFGGTHFHEMSPERRYYSWHGDVLLRKEVNKIMVLAEDFSEHELFNTEDFLASANKNSDIGINLLNTEFPYADKPWAVINMPHERVIYDFNSHKEIFRQKNDGSLEWNANSKIDAFLKDNNLWVRMPEGKECQLTTDGSQDIVYGQSVHRNEFGITKGIFFSEDGKKMAFYRMDQSMVTSYPQVNTFGDIATYEPDKYPMAGTASHKVRVGVYDIEKDSTIYLHFGDETDRYFTNIVWAPDDRSLFLIELNRDQNRQSLDEYNITTGDKIRSLCSEKDSKYVEPLHPITFLPWDNTKFIHWSQQDGYWHLYLYSTEDGKCLKQLTKGKFVILEVIGFNNASHQVIVQANRESPLQKNIYAVSIDDCSITLLDNGRGVHTASINHTGNRLVDKWTAPTTSCAWTLIDIDKHDNTIIKKGKDPWEDYIVPQYTTGTLTAADDKTLLYYRMVLPADFDAKKKYPTILYVYGGPHAHNIEASWHWNSRSWETYMAQKGYIIFVLDNRGSENRGKDFEQATFRQLGQIEMADQMRGVEYLKSLPYVNTDRLGVHGWSFGGFMTISLMTTYPDVFKVGVAGGPVIDWRKYEVMYTERYMDTPQQNPEGYSKTCLVDKAENLKGHLLVVIGGNDPVVVPQHSMMFINACNECGTYPDFYIYPGEGHNMQGHMSVHLHEKITRYFEDFLK